VPASRCIGAIPDGLSAIRTSSTRFHETFVLPVIRQESLGANLFTSYNRLVSGLINMKTAPVWLPLLAFARDSLAFQYLFFHEPAITEHAVKVGYLFMLPGSLVGGGFVTVVANMVLALGAGLICRWMATRRQNNSRQAGQSSTST
jgi:hypothetical protein